eukprot:scaffold77492_cov20-Tisochrysis_lutea.AAC.4
MGWAPRPPHKQVNAPALGGQQIMGRATQLFWTDHWVGNRSKGGFFLTEHQWATKHGPSNKSWRLQTMCNRLCATDHGPIPGWATDHGMGVLSELSESIIKWEPPSLRKCRMCTASRQVHRLNKCKIQVPSRLRNKAHGKQMS